MLKKHAGFTLIELIIVVVLIAILGAIFLPSISDTSKGAKATRIKESVADISQNWLLMNNKCGTTSAIVASHPIAASGSAIEDVLFQGLSAVHADKQACYKASKVVPLAELAEKPTAATKYSIMGYELTLGGGGTAPLTATLADVPDDIVLPLIQIFDSSTTALSATAVDRAAYAYGAEDASTGTRDVTIKKYID